MEQNSRTALERAVLLLRASLLVPAWQPTAGQGLVWAIRCAIVLGVLLLTASAVDKTLWDWLKILAVPITVGAAVPLLNWLQKKRELEIANQRAQHDTLQAYLDQMGKLILETSLLVPQPRDDEKDRARTLAQARTLTVLERLDDPDHKRSVLQFLYKSKLIARCHPDEVHKGLAELGKIREKPIIEFKGGGTRKQGANLAGANLAGVGLTGANLTGVMARKANLADHADLGGVVMEVADLTDAKMQKVNLTFANLGGTYINGADLRDAILRGAILNAKFNNAILRGADLSDADLTGAELTNADLREANLSNANLSGAYKVNNEGSKRPITNEQLEQQACSLKGATMPNGRKYEDLLKDKEGRGVYRGNSDRSQ